MKPGACPAVTNRPEWPVTLEADSRGYRAALRNRVLSRGRGAGAVFEVETLENYHTLSGARVTLSVVVARWLLLEMAVVALPPLLLR